MARFNIALIPVDAGAQIFFVDLAQFFKSTANGYLLGSDALTHVTLCQFRAEESQVAKQVFSSWTSKTNIALRVGQFQFRKGTRVGMVWAEVLVEKAPLLLNIQRECVRHVSESGFETLTRVETYSPHITLALIPEDAVAVSSLMTGMSHKEAISFRPAVGASTENGAFTKEL